MAISRFLAGALVGALAACAALHSALAETAAPPPSTVDSRTDGQKSAFLAMAEADRKAVQDALGWLGLYNGAVDGAFGKRTRDSIVAYQSRVGATADGLLSAAQFAALKAAAQDARAAVGFELVDERRSGVRLGAPLKILEKIAMVDGSVVMKKADGSVTLAMQARIGEDADLVAQYAKRTAAASGRKVTYKAIKADQFFVVAGEEAGRKFYSRFAAAPADWPDGRSLRGFTFSYPISQAADLDKVALGIANTFEPFLASAASLGAAAARAAPSVTWRDVVKVMPASAPSPAPAVAPADAAVKTPPIAPELTATGLIVAPGQALTAIGEADCANPTIEGKAAKSLRGDAASGLTLLAGDFGAAAAPLNYGAGSTDLVVLAVEPSATPGTSVLQASVATTTPDVDGGQAIVAALTKSASGAPAFDRKGGLEALVGPIRIEPKRLAGVALVEPHSSIALDAIKRFLGPIGIEAAAETPDLGAGEIARDRRASIVQIVCRR